VWIKDAERADPDDPEDICFWVAGSFDRFYSSFSELPSDMQDGDWL